MTQLPHHECADSRRDFLTRAGGGMGLLALMSLLDGDGRADEPAAPSVNPLAAKPPQFKATAKSVIWCFLDGGPSHIDLFDPKPELAKLAGRPLPPSFNRPVTAMGRTPARRCWRRSESLNGTAKRDSGSPIGIRKLRRCR